jgi:hypothetical protein
MIVFLSGLKSIGVAMNFLVFSPWISPSITIHAPRFTDVDYVCAPLRWIKEPLLKGGLLDAELSASCEFTAIGGGGFSQLKSYLENKIETESEIIHSGPTPVMFRGIPAEQYDVSAMLADGKDSVRARQDIFIATDLNSRLILDSKSTEVIGQGNGKYLKKVNGNIQVDVTDLDDRYQAIIGSAFQMEKPFIVPGPIFKDMVKKEVEKQFLLQQKAAITELAKNL